MTKTVSYKIVEKTYYEIERFIDEDHGNGCGQLSINPYGMFDSKEHAEEVLKILENIAGWTGGGSSMVS